MERYQKVDNMQPVNRFMKFVDIQQGSECLFWMGGKCGDGYGHFSFNKKDVLAHRWIWEYSEGLIPDGKILDHTCRVRNCVNTNHLRVVTHQTNAIENNVGPTAINAAKTHCVNGHEFIKNNVYSYRGERHCKECRRIHVRTNMKKVRETPEYKQRMAEYRLTPQRKEYMETYRKEHK